MITTISNDASALHDGSPDCQFVTLGQKLDANHRPLNHNLKGFIYESESGTKWQVAVLCNFAKDTALVKKIVPCKKIKESPPGWK